MAFFNGLAGNPALNKVLPFVLYETLGPTLPEGLSGAAALWGLAQKAAMTCPGHADGNALFTAILSSRSGLTFTEHEYADDWALISHPDRKIALPMPEMLADLGVAPNSLTSTEWRDAHAGTPWHKHVPARIEAAV